MVTASRYVALAAVLCLAGCKQAVPNTSADAAQIEKLDDEWVKAAATHRADAWDAYYSDDAAVLPPNEKVADSKEKIRASMASFLSLPGLTVTWKPIKIVVTAAGTWHMPTGATT